MPQPPQPIVTIDVNNGIVTCTPDIVAAVEGEKIKWKAPKNKSCSLTFRPPASALPDWPFKDAQPPGKKQPVPAGGAVELTPTHVSNDQVQYKYDVQVEGNPTPLDPIIIVVPR
jgi:hypothetical protein